MNRHPTRWLAAACLCCVVIAGCSASADKASYSSYSDHDAVLAEYRRIAARANALVKSKSSADPAVSKEMHDLAEKMVGLKHRKLMLVKQPSLQQAQEYDSLDASFQTALHAVCPTCPGRGK